jgi:O-acetyl-ADP-ribose deacetylase (regulator of RNase III)
MSDIQYITFDVTKVTRGVVAHGCNCQGVMGSGVARAIRDKWPVVFRRYHEFVRGFKETEGETKGMLGIAQTLNVGNEFVADINTLFVSNMFTQDKYGADGKVYADPAAIETALDATMAFCRGADLPLYMPKVGCGLGGLNWESDVQPIVERLHAKYGIPVFVCTI